MMNFYNSLNNINKYAFSCTTKILIIIYAYITYNKTIFCNNFSAR